MLPLLLALALTTPDPAPAPTSSAPALAQADEDRLADDFGDDLPPPPPPLPDEEEAETDAEAEPGEEVAPPPPPPLPSADPAEGTPPPAFEPSQPSAPSAAGPTEPVNRFLAAAITTAGGVALALPTGACCFCCNVAGCWGPPVCGAVGSGGGAIAGAMIAGVPVTDALLPALGAAGLGLLGGLVAMPCGVATSAAVLTILTGSFAIVPSGGAFASTSSLLASGASGVVVAMVMIVGSAAAGGLTWILLPEEVETKAKATRRPKAVRAPAEAPLPKARTASAVAY